MAERDGAGVQPIGPKLAEGRDSEIFEHGPGRVLRMARDGRSLEAEAEVMRYVREQGYPAPEVHESGQGYLVMERLDGPTMMAAVVKHPGRIRAYGRLLASLHERLHRIPAPGGLPEAGVAGDRIVHRDLHPLNVLMTGDGPAVIDWANAARGDPAYDLADTWVLLATAELPGGPVARAVAGAGRRMFLRSFLAEVDADSARAAIPAAVENRLTDRNMTEAERLRMKRLSAWAAGRSAR